eukprot:3988829-Pyramimonas_sp.AAC.2
MPLDSLHAKNIQELLSNFKRDAVRHIWLYTADMSQTRGFHSPRYRYNTYEVAAHGGGTCRCRGVDNTPVYVTSLLHCNTLVIAPLPFRPPPPRTHPVEHPHRVVVVRGHARQPLR